MNIVILSGSPRKGGNTEMLAESFAQGASSRHNVDFVSVRDYHVYPCKGCNSCFKREDKSCIQKDDMKTIYDKLGKSYTAAKGGIAALTHALAVTLRSKARVNSISPGWIDTDYKEYDGPDAVQQPAGRVGNPMDIANMVLFLCSDKAGFITGENICIDGGMTRQMVYHGDHGWTLTE